MSKDDNTIDMEFDGKTYKRADVDKFAKNYSDAGLFDKITGSVKKAGLALIYKALQLFYVAKNPNAPLGYFISPIDFVPDITPFVGFTDDAGIIAAAMVIAHAYIDDEVRSKAKDSIRSMFGDAAAAELD